MAHNVWKDVAVAISRTLKSITLEDLSKILYHSLGITHVESGEEREKTSRPYPSVSKTFPLETYLIIFKMEDLKPGVYHYDVRSHNLELMMEGNFVEEIVKATQNESLINASIIFAVSAVFQKAEFKYGDRGYRYVLFEAGHLAQNIHFLTTLMDLSFQSVGEFIDDTFNKILDIDGYNESVIYVAAIG